MTNNLLISSIPTELLRSTQTKIRVKFVTDRTTTKRGFRLKWTALKAAKQKQREESDNLPGKLLYLLFRCENVLLRFYAFLHPVWLQDFYPGNQVAVKEYFVRTRI